MCQNKITFNHDSQTNLRRQTCYATGKVMCDEAQLNCIQINAVLVHPVRQRGFISSYYPSTLQCLGIDQKTGLQISSILKNALAKRQVKWVECLNMQKGKQAKSEG